LQVVLTANRALEGRKGPEGKKIFGVWGEKEEGGRGLYYSSLLRWKRKDLLVGRGGASGTGKSILAIAFVAEKEGSFHEKKETRSVR